MHPEVSECIAKYLLDRLCVSADMHSEENIIMALSITGGVPAQLADTTVHVQAKSKQAPQIQLPTDTVTLSLSVQVSQLALQGQSPSEIAQSLGMLQSAVDSDLSISR
jgi:hypothetical protein